MRTVFAPSSSFVNVSIFANQKIVTYVLPAFLVHVMVLNASIKQRKPLYRLERKPPLDQRSKASEILIRPWTRETKFWEWKFVNYISVSSTLRGSFKLSVCRAEKTGSITWKLLTLAWQIARVVQLSVAEWWIITNGAGSSARFLRVDFGALAPHSDLDIILGRTKCRGKLNDSIDIGKRSSKTVGNTDHFFDNVLFKWKQSILGSSFFVFFLVSFIDTIDTFGDRCVVR